MMRGAWLAAGVAALVGSVAAGVASGDVVREGSGSRRATLDSMELKPAPLEWSELSEWINSDGVDATSVAGKPVLIVTWASWVPRSVSALGAAQRIADQYASKGLVVVGVHAPQGWDGAQAAVDSKKVTFPVAHDASNAFRDALLVDNDPDYYVIDRAGQLRYADVATASVEEAVAKVVGESADAAGNVQAIIDQRAANERADQEKLRNINESLTNLRDIPDLPFAEPTPEDYERADLPELSDDVRDLLGLQTSSRGFRGNNEELPDVKITLPQGGEWIGGQTPNYKGRAVVLYFWHPKIRNSYWPMMERMDVLQRKYARDVVVIGVMLPMELLSDNSRRGRGNTPDETAQELRDAWNRFMTARKFDHRLYLDAGGSVIGSLGGSGRRGRGGTALIDGVYVISSDGVLRWAGFSPNREYQGTLDKVLAHDPAIEARREAERRFIEGGR